MNETTPDAGAEFGNLEANLRFLDESRVLQPRMRVLEIGTGSGSLLHTLRRRGLDVVGVDTSHDRIAEAHARFGDMPIQQTVGVSLPYADASFDAVLSFDVLEHIPGTDAHLDEVRRVLKPGGWYLLQTPNKWTNTVFETIRWRSFTRWRQDHCSLHSYAELERRFERHGFETTFADVRVVTPYYRDKVRRHLGRVGSALLAVMPVDRLPRRLRTNFYVVARKPASPKPDKTVDAALAARETGTT
jgi:cyclopropane fatty-acyl-phospholipid synthase-like methyltransferase